MASPQVTDSSLGGNVRSDLLRGYSNDSTLGRPRRRKKSRAVSSRSRLLMLPSFSEAWRIEQQDLLTNNHGNNNGNGGGPHELEQSTWVHATFIVVGEILGSGVLGLP